VRYLDSAVLLLRAGSVPRCAIGSPICPDSNAGNFACALKKPSRDPALPDPSNPAGEPGPRRCRQPLPIACALLLVAACTTYTPKPLGLKAAFPGIPRELTVDAAELGLPELAAHRFDPADGLDMVEVATLAVARNPDLRIARDDVGIADAQAFAAGLLPDPQLGLSQDFPDDRSQAVNAFGVTLSYDISALVTRSTARKAARAQRRKVNLTLLWQEWQVVGQARLLFVRITGRERSMQWLEAYKDLLTWRYGLMEHALSEGNQTLDVATADFTALRAAERQVAEALRQQAADRSELNKLLGLAPSTVLDLTRDDDVPKVDADKVMADLEHLARRRPDLLALEAAYENQDQRLRGAILAQFPALNIGLTRSKDNTGIYSRGFAVSLSLPIFDRNQGNVRIEAATRQRLFDEAQARVNAAHSDVVHLVTDQRALEAQVADLSQSLSRLQVLAEKAGVAFRSGDIEALAFANIRASLINKQIDLLAVEQTIQEQRVALETILGHELPPADQGDRG